MNQTIIINDMTFHASDVQVESVMKNGKERRKLSFAFKVSHDAYHDVTTLLYKNDFNVKVPGRNIEFPAVITNYSTSITNLYKPGAVGDFKLELTEKD